MMGVRIRVIRSVRARYSGGVLEPLEALDLDEGEEVLVTVDDQSPEFPKRPSDELLAADKAWREQHDYEALKRMIYLAREEGSSEPPNG